eukprot:354172-Chlamydomonas_euryale.AAC.3
MPRCGGAATAACRRPPAGRERMQHRTGSSHVAVHTSCHTFCHVTLPCSHTHENQHFHTCVSFQCVECWDHISKSPLGNLGSGMRGRSPGGTSGVAA